MSHIRHMPCPECGSKDNLAVYPDHGYCFGCGYRESYTIVNEFTRATDQPKKGRAIKDKSIQIGLAKTPRPLSDRGLDASSVGKYRVATTGKYIHPVTNEVTVIEAAFPRFDKDGEHVANQLRFADKTFKCEGDLDKALLFGQIEFPEGGKSITITEGYYDTLSVFQMTGSRYPAVGVMSASTAKKEIVNNFEYLNSFEQIIINFDNDKTGQDAAKECAQLFAPGKVKILALHKAKDANEYLKEGWDKVYVNEWFRAPVYMPDGLQLGSDPQLLEDIIKYKEPRSIPYPWTGLNHKTYGIRTSELVLLTADTGDGKTTVCKEIEYALLMHPDLIEEQAGVGFLHLEEPKRDLAVGLMSVHNSKPYHFPDVERTEQELREAYKAVLDTDRVVIWDHFGSNDIDVVLAKIRHMAALGCRYIFLDHLSIVVSDQSGDERKQLDEISTKIKTLTMNLDIAVIAVIHINRQGQVRGSAGPEQVSNIVIRLERDKKSLDDWRRNVTRITVEKNRKFGRTGPACYLFYNEMTGRLEELSKELAEVYESGGNIAGHEFEAYDND